MMNTWLCGLAKRPDFINLETGLNLAKKYRSSGCDHLGYGALANPDNLCRFGLVVLVNKVFQWDVFHTSSVSERPLLARLFYLSTPLLIVFISWKSRLSA